MDSLKARPGIHRLLSCRCCTCYLSFFICLLNQLLKMIVQLFLYEKNKKICEKLSPKFLRITVPAENSSFRLFFVELFFTCKSSFHAPTNELETLLLRKFDIKKHLITTNTLIVKNRTCLSLTVARSAYSMYFSCFLKEFQFKDTTPSLLISIFSADWRSICKIFNQLMTISFGRTLNLWFIAVM